jgi:two-component system OmpR family response regulator
MLNKEWAHLEPVILVVEDEQKLRDMLVLHLRQECFVVAQAADGQEALNTVQNINPDLVVLDLMLPKLSGWEVLKNLRQKHSVPVIILTARTDEVDKLLGLELGADDYLTKPFSPRELIARIRAILRRTHSSSPTTFVNVGDLTIHPTRMEAAVDDRKLSLTTTEFKILLLLAENPGQVFSRLYILERVFGDMYEGYERTIDTHISNLRHKIEAAQASSFAIKTIYGIGYKLVAEE